MAATDALLAQAPRLATDRISVTGPSEQGDMSLTDRDGGAQVRLSALEYDLVRRLDGRHSVALVHAQFAEETRADVSAAALLSLLGQLGRANLLDLWQPAPSALPGGERLASSPADEPPSQATSNAWQQRVEATERALLAADQDAARSAPATAPRSDTVPRVLQQVPVDEAEILALAQQALARVAAGDLQGASNILRQAFVLAPKQLHLGLWSTRLRQLAAVAPQPKPAAVWQQLLTLAPVAAGKLSPPAGLVHVPRAVDRADAVASLVVLLAREASQARGVVAPPPLSDQTAVTALPASQEPLTAPPVPAAPPHVPHLAEPLAPEPSLSRALPPEGTLGLPAADADVALLAPRGRRLAPWLAAAGATLALVLLGYGLFWRLPQVSGVVVGPAAYRLHAPGDVAAISWPHNSNVAAPIGGTLVAAATIGTDLEAQALLATLQPDRRAAALALRQGLAAVQRLSGQKQRLLAALARFGPSQPDPWQPMQRISPGSHARLQRLQQQRTTLEPSLARARAECKRLEAAAALAERATRVVAPWPARVTWVAQVQGRLRQGALLARLQDRHLVRLTLQSAETFGRRVGDQVSVLPSADATNALVGHIVDLEGPPAPPTGAIDRATRRAEPRSHARLLIDVVDPAGELAAAAASAVSVVLEEVPMAAEVPLAALHLDEQGPWLWLVSGAGHLGRQHVTVLKSGSRSAWLRWPQHAGDALQVVVDERAQAMLPHDRVRFVRQR